MKGLLLLDFKMGVRMLARYPGLTLVGTLGISVGIALGTVYFEVINKVLNPRLPIQGGDRMISIRNWDASALEPEARSLHDFAIWREQLREPFVIAKLERFGRGRRIAPHGEEGMRTTPEATAS